MTWLLMVSFKARQLRLKHGLGHGPGVHCWHGGTHQENLQGSWAGVGDQILPHLTTGAASPSVYMFYVHVYKLTFQSHTSLVPTFIPCHGLKNRVVMVFLSSSSSPQAFFAHLGSSYELIKGFGWDVSLYPK